MKFPDLNGPRDELPRRSGRHCYNRAMNADEIKRHEREAYDAVAEVFNLSMAQYSARFSRDLIDLMFPQNGEAALDIAGGTGATGLKLAERVGKDGNVTIADISPGMLEQAQKNAV